MILPGSPALESAINTPVHPEHHVRAKLIGDMAMRDLGERFADPLYAALQERAFGDLTGGSGQQAADGGMEWLSIDIRLVNLDDALAFTRRTLHELGAPPGSELAYTRDGQTYTILIDDPVAI